MKKNIFLALKFNIPSPMCVSIDDILKGDFSEIYDSYNNSEFFLPLDIEIEEYEKDKGGYLNDDGTIVGVIKGWIIKTGWMIDWRSKEVEHEFEKISEEFFELYKLIRNKKDIQKVIEVEDTYYISRIEIKNEYRNQMIGSSVFPLLSQTFEGFLKMPIGQIILRSYPLEYIGKYREDNIQFKKIINNAKKRLFAFYERVGFVRISKRQDFMIYNCR